MRRTYTWAMALVATLVLGLVGAVPADAVDPTYTVTVKVATPGGTGISGVYLSASSDSPSYYAGDYASGTGVVTFADVPATTALALSGSVYVGGTSKAISQTFAVSADVSKTVTVAGTQVIAGKVTDKSSGAGLASASVSASAWSGSGSGGYGTSGSDGTYAVLVPAGAYRVSFYASSGGYLYSYYPGTTDYSAAKKVTVASGKDVKGINAALVKPGKLTGKVTYAGKPVAGISVYASSTDNVSGGFGTTSATGAYTTTVNPGTYTLGIYRKPTSPFLSTYYGGTVRAPDAKKVSVGSGKTLTGISIAAKAGATLKGVVKSSSGKPVKGAGVYAYNTTRTGYASATTNAKGAYVLHGLASGKVTVTANAPHGATYGTKNATASQGKTRTVRAIVLKSPGTATIKGKVAVKSGKVIDTTAVLLTSKKAYAGQVTPTTKGVVTFKNVPAGTYTVVLSGTNLSTKVTVKAKKTASFGKLTRPKLTTVKGTVKSPKGTLVPRASVSLYDSFGTYAGSTSTNSKGAYSIKGLVKGKYTVTAYDNDGLYVSASTSFTAKSGKNVTKALKLKTGGTLKGVVKNARGKPVAGVNVSTSDGYAVTNAQGAYVIKGVAAGRTTVSFSDPYVGGYLYASKSATVKAGKTASVATVKLK